MKEFVTYLPGAFLLLLPLFSFGQTCTDKLPDDWDFTDSKGLEKYEPIVHECINWLNNTSIDSASLTRNKAMKFIHDWGKYSPTILLFPYSNVSNAIFNDIKKGNIDKQYATELYTSYFAGMIKFLLKDNPSAQLHEVQIAGIENLLLLHKNNKTIIGTPEAVAFYKTKKQNGELESWVKKKLTRKEIKSHNCHLNPDCKRNIDFSTSNKGAHKPY